MTPTLKHRADGLLGLVINLVVTVGAPLGVWRYGASWFAFGVFAAGAAFSMVAVELGYHRFFAHKAFKTGRAFQLLLALCAELVPMRGPIWWAATHRDHHRLTDTPEDPHSPRRGAWRSYMWWAFAPENIAHDCDNAAELKQFPELVLADKLFLAPFLVSAVALYALGAWLERAAPGLHTSGPQLVVWGAFLRLLYPAHVVTSLNYFAHHPRFHFGYRTFATRDASRNLPLLGYLGAGIGWHNNHHRSGNYATTQVYWWELDPTAWVIRLLERLGIVWGVRWPPASFREEADRTRRSRREDPAFQDPFDAGFPA